MIRGIGIRILCILLLVVVGHGLAGAVRGAVVDEISVIGNAIRLVQTVGMSDMNLHDISNAALKGIAQALGDGSRYLTPHEVRAMQERSERLIGLLLGVDDDAVVVRDILDGSPASRSLIEIGDRIISVDGVAVHSDVHLTRRLIQREPNERVTLEVQRAGIHSEISVERDEPRELRVGWDLIGNVAVITVEGFGAQTSEEVRVLLEKMHNLGVSKCVVDLRTNGGGDVDRAVDVVAMLTGSKHAGYYQERGALEELVSSHGALPTVDLPDYAVLIGAKTASAGELLAAALADRSGAILVGQRTVGKSTVQRNYPLHNGGVFNLTIGRLYRVTGDSWEKRGLTPDIIVGDRGVQDILIPHRTLVEGMVGLDVLRLQHWLTDTGYHPGVWDGVMGDDTLRAVNAFRIDFGLDEVLELRPMDVLAMLQAHRSFMHGTDDPVMAKAIEALNSREE